MIFLKSHKEKFSSIEELLQLVQWQTGNILIFQANLYGSKQTQSLKSLHLAFQLDLPGREEGEGRGRSSPGFQVEL